jgi:hypothetical protein
VNICCASFDERRSVPGSSPRRGWPLWLVFGIVSPPLLADESLQELGRGNGRVQDAAAGRVVDGVADRGGGPDDADLADALGVSWC